jgi:transmembrane sensor
MNAKPTPLSKYVPVEVSPARVARIWASVSARVGSRPLQSGRYLLAVVAAVGLIVGAGAGFWVAAGRWHGANSSFGAALQTAGDGLTVDLDDGSKLELASNTRVRVLPGDARNAAIQLQNGRVVCDVASSSKRHFSVFVAELEVRDTGTRFSVSRDSDSGQVEVAVERGSVLIVGPSGVQGGKSLAAGERWFRDRSRALDSAKAPPTSVTTTAPAASPAGTSLDAVPATAMARALDAGMNNDSAPGTTDVPNAQALFEQGNVARRSGNSAAAARAYQTLLNRHPNDSRAGLAALELGRLRIGPLSDVPGAIRAFEMALAHAPGAGFREDALAHLIAAHAASGEIAKCRSLRETYLNDYPHGVHVTLVERQCSPK